MIASREDLAVAFGAIALEAGRLIMNVRAHGATANLKRDGSPVTQADLQADRCIRTRLAALLPGLSVVTEETAQSHALADGRFILVDPLDGTREFIAGRPEFTVNIALIEDGAPQAGAVYAPALEKLYIAGEQAYFALLASDRSMPSLDALQPITASAVPAQDWRAVVSRSHLDPSTQQWLDAMPIATHCAAGSSLKFCVIAEGGADVYPRFSPTMEWDTAAGHAVLAAAGGMVVGLDDAPLSYGKRQAGLFNPPFIAWGKR